MGLYARRKTKCLRPKSSSFSIFLAFNHDDWGDMDARNAAHYVWLTNDVVKGPLSKNKGEYIY
jgi:hypothetical protein